MPKRTTLTFTSENAAKPDEEQLLVYYCKYSGRHALTTNISLGKLPRRKMDNSRVLDTQLYTAKLYTDDGGTKLIKRHNGKIEKQYRLNVGVLPIAYRAEEDGRWGAAWLGAAGRLLGAARASAAPRRGRAASAALQRPRGRHPRSTPAQYPPRPGARAPRPPRPPRRAQVPVHPGQRADRVCQPGGAARLAAAARAAVHQARRGRRHGGAA
jgi:hypothetical protein